MTLNRFLALVCLFFAVAIQAQPPLNNKVRGIVTIQNTGKPLKGVLVSPDCGNPFSSTDSGFFEVECRGKAPGEEVSLSITPPSGYRVLNQNEVKSAVILREAKTSVRVVVCKTKDWEKEVLRYNGIMRDYDLNEKMDAQSARIEEIPDQIQQVVGQGNEELLKEIAEKLASFDRDQASDIVKEAFKAADARDINRAIDLMPDHLLEQEIAESAEKYRKSVENYMVKARFCVTAGRFDDAAANYRKAVTHDSLNAEHLSEYAKFLLHIEQPDAAIQYYEKCLQIKSVDPKDRLAATTGMSVGYMAKRDFEKAESVLLTGLEEARTLVLSDRPKYLNGLQDIYESLSLLYMIMRRCDQALLFKQQEIDVSAENAEEKDAAYYNSALMAKNILGVLYNATGNPAKANQLCDESIAECRKLFASNDSAYAAILAQVLENKVYMRYVDSFSAPEVEILLREAVKLRQTYTNRKTAIGDALAGLASYYSLIGNRQESVKYWMETIRLLLAEQKRTPFKAVERLQYAYSAMFQHYLHLENIDSCLYYSYKKLELVSGWAKTHPGIYDVDLGYALSQLSVVFLNNEQVDSAIFYINQAVPLRRQLLQEYSVARHIPGNHTLLIEENELYFKLNDDFCNKLDSADLLDNRQEDLGFSYSALGLAWFKKNDTWRRDSFYRLATDIFEDLVRRNPEVYEYHYGVMLLDWVKAYGILDPKNPLTLELGERVLAIAKKQTSDDLALLMDVSTPLSSLYFDNGRITEVIDLATLKIAMINKSETINPKEMQAALAGAFQLRSAMNMKLQIEGHTLEDLTKSVAIFETLTTKYPDEYKLERAQSVFNLGEYYRFKSRFDSADLCFERSMGLLRPLFLSDTNLNTALAQVLASKARLYYDLDRPVDMAWLQEAGRLMQKSSATMPKEYGDVLWLTAVCYKKRQDIVQAGNYYRQAIFWMRKAIESGQMLNENYLSVNEEYFLVLQESSAWSELRNRTEDLLKFASNHFSPDSASYWIVSANAANLIGLALSNMDSVGPATGYFQQSKDFYQHILTPATAALYFSDYFNAVSNLSLMLTHKGKYDEAIALCREILDRIERDTVIARSPKSDIYKLRGWVALMEIYEQKPDPDKMKETIFHAVRFVPDLHIEPIDSVHFLTYSSVIYRNQGHIFITQNEPAKAAEALTKSLFYIDLLVKRDTSAEVSLCNILPEIAQCSFNAGDTATAFRRYREATTVMKHMLAKRKDPDPKNKEILAQTLNSFGAAAFLAGDLQVASDALNQARDIFRSMLGADDNPDVQSAFVTTSVNLLATRHRAGAVGPAETLYAEMYTMLEQNQSLDDIQTFFSEAHKYFDTVAVWRSKINADWVKLLYPRYKKGLGPDDLTMAQINYFAGNAAFLDEQFEVAIPYISESVALFKKCRNPKNQTWVEWYATAINDLGALQMQKAHDNKEAFLLIQEALGYRRELVATSPAYINLLLKTLHNLTLYHYLNEDPVKSDAFLKEGIDLCKKTDPGALAQYGNEISKELMQIAAFLNQTANRKMLEEVLVELLDISILQFESNPAGFYQTLMEKADYCSEFYFGVLTVTNDWQQRDKAIQMWKRVQDAAGTRSGGNKNGGLDELHEFIRTKIENWQKVDSTYIEDARLQREIQELLNGDVESYQEKTVNLEKALALMEPLRVQYPEDETLRDLILQAYTMLSVCALYTGDFVKAEKSADAAIAMNPSQLGLHAYRAHALLFQNNRYQEAKSLYILLKGQVEPTTGRPFREILLEGLKALEDANISSPNVQLIRDEVLNQK